MTQRRGRTHEQLWKITKNVPQDYEPYGKQKRTWTSEAESGMYEDCSCGCRFYVVLAGDLGLDWGICSNPRSHRAGLLTFEHQGCPAFRE